MRSSGKLLIRFSVCAAAVLLSVTLALIFYSGVVPKKYDAEIAAACREFGLEQPLVYAVIRTESSFSPQVKSDAGAVGLMQLMPSTAAFAAEKLREEEIDLFDPACNLRLGCWYLKYLLGRFSEVETALAAYNAGEGTVARWLRDEAFSENGAVLDKIPYAETENYVRRVKFFWKCYKISYSFA